MNMFSRVDDRSIWRAFGLFYQVQKPCNLGIFTEFIEYHPAFRLCPSKLQKGAENVLNALKGWDKRNWESI